MAHGPGRARLPRSPSSARRTRPPHPRRRSTASGSFAGLEDSRSTRRGCGRCAAATLGGSTSWSTCRTGCPSSPGWSPHARSWCWSTMCTASSGRWSIPAWTAGSAGGSSTGWPRCSTGACQYVAVSRATRAELRQLGVTGARVAVVHNGTDPVVPVRPGKEPTPMICRRRTPGPPQAGRARHRRLARVARAVPGPAPARGRQRLVGGRLHAYAAEHGAGETVVFEGHVDENAKQAIYERAWVLALPSLKEGWGLVDRRGRHARHARRSPTDRPAGPGSRSPTALGRPRRHPGGVHRALGDAARRRAPPQRPGRRRPRVQPHLHMAARPAFVRARGAGGAGRSARGEPGP